MASLADIEREARAVLDADLRASWSCKAEQTSPFNVKVSIVADRGTDTEAMLAVRAALQMTLDQVRPVGCVVEIEITAEEDLPGDIDDFVAQMRALRGDYGVCAHCGDRFGEREATTTDPRGRVHPKCAQIGICAGCAKPVVKSDHSTLCLGTRTHTDCVDRAVEADRQRKEREARAAARGQAQRTRGALVAAAVEHARGMKCNVALIVPDREVETVATSIAHGYAAARPRGKLVANMPGRKAIAWDDSAGMVIVESALRSSLGEAGKGYARAYLTREVCAESPDLPAFVASCFDLSPGQVVREEE